MYCSVVQCSAVYCSVVQCIVVQCSVASMKKQSIQVRIKIKIKDCLSRKGQLIGSIRSIPSGYGSAEVPESLADPSPVESKDLCLCYS